MASSANTNLAAQVDQYLQQQDNKTMLRFITCGSVDDGKSTLLGRLLQDTNAVFEDQLAAAAEDSRKWGTQGDSTDIALLVDGLAAEREQGITIDVAYRYFATESRKFIVADTPGHVQYTRNMVTGASTADAAVVLVDARNGLQTQTRRHSYLLSLLGLKNVVLAINKMDLVDYSEEIYNRILDDYSKFANEIGIKKFTTIPVSALHGDNIVEPSTKMKWYRGTTLLSCLETIEVNDSYMQSMPFRLPVQWVNRPNANFRGYAGPVVSGTVKPGDSIRVLPSGKSATIERVLLDDIELSEAVAGQSVTLTLSEEIDVIRGDVISTAEAPISAADQFETSIVWMHEDDMLPGRPYLLKIGSQLATATITDIKYEVNVNTLEHIAAKSLKLNRIAVCNINTDKQIAFDAYEENRDTGSFILIDRENNNTVGAGMLHFALRRSDNIHMQAVDVDKSKRSDLKAQKPCVLWFTGLSGSGKSTVANLVEKKLAALGNHTYLLDGDNVRHGLNKDLGFTDADRVENIRRIGEVARLMVDSGLIVLTAFISPFRSERQMARGLVDDDEFIEVYMETPLSVAEERDPKGLYKKARRGELKNFTGIDSPYEAPENAEIFLDTSALSAEQAAERVVSELRRKGIIQGN